VKNLIFILAFAVLATAQLENFGPETELGVGNEPHCALGPDGTLHIVYKYGPIRYLTMDTTGTLSAPEMVSLGMSGDNPWVCVTKDGNVHVVFDTWSKAYYTNRIGGTWKTPVRLPQERDERNYMVQVSGGYADEVYTSQWSMTKGDAGFSLFSKVTNLATSPVAAKIHAASGDNRPPSVLGPTAVAQGDGKVHLFIGVPQTTHKILAANGSTSGNENISRTPGGKTVEGMQGFFIGTDVGHVTTWWNNVVPGQTVNSLSRAKAGKPGINVGQGSGEFPYPRAADDPVNKRAYILWEKNHRPSITIWDPLQNSAKQLGDLMTAQLSNETRGPGAGGIAPRRGGGVHVIYSRSNKLYHRTVGARPLSTEALSSRPRIQTGLRLSPNPLTSDGLLRLTSPGLSGRCFQVSVLDITGQLKQSVHFSGQALSRGFSLNTSNMASGTYLIKIHAPGKSYASRLFLSK
jgi:hypothetical protein